MKMQEKNNPKTQQIWHLGTPLWGYGRVSYSFRKLFSGTAFFNRTYYVSILTHLKVIKLQTWQYFQSRHRNSKYCAKHFRQIFSRATLASLYLEPFRSSLASKLTVLEKSTYGLLGDGSYPHKLYIFRKLFSRDTFASKIVRLYLQPLKGCKASKLTMLKNVTYFAMWRGTLGGTIPPHAIHF